MSKYLTREEARDYLVKTKAISESEELPHLDLVLERTEAEFEEWLGFCPIAQTYTEQYELENGTIVLRQYPVLEVQEVKSVFGDPDIRRDRLTFYWSWGKNHIEVPESINALYGYPYKIEVTYKAGYDPLPRRFIFTFQDLLRHAVTEGEYPGHFPSPYGPARDVQNISVSGISKSWKLGKTAESGKTETAMDRIMAPLKRYQRKIFW